MHLPYSTWSEDNFRCQSLPPTLFAAGSLVVRCNVQASWPVRFQGFSWHRLSGCGSSGVLNHAAKLSFTWTLGIWSHVFMLLHWMLCLLSYLAQDLHIWQLKGNIQLSLLMNNPWNLFTVATLARSTFLTDASWRNGCHAQVWWFSISRDIWYPKCPIGFCWPTLVYSARPKSSSPVPIPFLGFQAPCEWCLHLAGN